MNRTRLASLTTAVVFALGLAVLSFGAVSVTTGTASAAPASATSATSATTTSAPGDMGWQ